MTKKTMRPFWTYYGGKWRVARQYPAPKYETIIEPFAGAAGFSLRYFHHRVILVEKNPKVAATWRYLLKVSPQEVRNLPLLEGDQTVNDLKITEEAKLLVGWWLNKASTQPCISPSKWMRSGAYARQFWGPEIRERIASQVTQIRHWQLIEGDYENAPDIEATWFVDPPYFTAGVHYASGVDDYGRLAEWCRKRQGQVTVCENEGATWLPFSPFANIKSRRGVSKEVIWQNETTQADDLSYPHFMERT